MNIKEFMLLASKYFYFIFKIIMKCNYKVFVLVGNVVKWLKRHDCDQHGLSSKPTHAFLLCHWERHFTTLFPVWQAVLNFSNIFIKLQNQNKKFQVDSNILASQEIGQANCLPYILVPLSLF